MTTLDELIEKSSMKDPPIVAVASAADREVLEAIEIAVQKGIAHFLLFAQEAELQQLITEKFPRLLSQHGVSFRNTTTVEEAAEHAVKAVSTREAHVLMKGNLPTAVILKAVLNKQYGLRTNSILSHVAAFEVQGYDKLLFVTDAAMNIAPDLEAKAQIIQNAVSVAKACGVEMPIVAPLCAVETVNPAMQPTIDAAALVAMNNRGQIKDCIVDGPLALDNAISLEAAEQKGIRNGTAGKADILAVPNIEAGNILYKSLMYFAGAKVGAVIAGAKAPIVLTSRADSAESKLYSLAVAIQTASLSK